MEATMGKLKNKKGLTLIELIAVIVIIGIIAAIAIPSVGNVIARSKTSADKANQVLIKDAAARYALEATTTTASDGTVSLASTTPTALATAGYLTNAITWNNAIHTVTTITFANNTLVPDLGSTVTGFKDLTE